MITIVEIEAELMNNFKLGELSKSEVEERTDEILILAWIGTKCRQLEQGDRSNRSVGS